jgi:hypothetical protein
MERRVMLSGGNHFAQAWAGWVWMNVWQAQCARVTAAVGVAARVQTRAALQRTEVWKNRGAGAAELTGGTVQPLTAQVISPSAGLPGANTVTMSTLTMDADTTLALNLITPGAGVSVNDKVVVTGVNGLTINGGTLQITGVGVGAESLGYYKAIQYSGALGGSVGNVVMPAAVGNVVYTLDTTRDAGWVDVHRGFLGDANDSGTVDFNDFVVLSQNFGSLGGWSQGNFGGGPTVDFADFVVLSQHFGQSISNNALTGSEFSGATAQPAAVGAGAGLTTKAIARWDVVPHQTFSGVMNVGVVAFNSTLIDHVSFSVNGGAWMNVTQMSLNPTTNVHEYWVPVNAADLPDGPVEVRAIAYPKVGNPRVLQGPVANNGNNALVLYANSHGTLPQQQLYVSTTGNDTTGTGTQANPYKTILKAATVATSGATINLQAGTYPFATRVSGFNTNDRWITITAAPGVARSSVIVQPRQEALRVYHLAVRNVTIDCTLGYEFYSGNGGFFGPDSELWLDNCDISSSLGKSHLPELGAPIDTTWPAAYMTDTTLHDYPGRAIASPFVAIVRNVRITNIGNDAIDNPQLVVNTTIDTVIANDPAFHIDAIQYFSDHSDVNSIVYNVKATNVDGQLIFGGLLVPAQGGPVGGTFSNAAVVNYLATSLTGPVAQPFASQIGAGLPGDNLVFYNMTLPNQNFLFTNDPGAGQFTNTVVDGSVFWRLYEPQTAGIAIRETHIIDFANQASAIPVGSFTTGDPGFVSDPLGNGTYAGTGNFHLKVTSVLKGRVNPQLVRVDLDGILRGVPASIGVYE